MGAYGRSYVESFCLTPLLRDLLVVALIAVSGMCGVMVVDVVRGWFRS